MGFRPEVQGLRGVAVLVVVAYHAGVPGFGGGYVGVDVFFVISGFLIVGLMIDEIGRSGRLDVWAFWGRRVRRLAPAATLVLVTTVVVAKFVVPPLQVVSIGKDALAAAFSVSNVRFAAAGVDYLGATAASPVQHFWSLSTEEQFYVGMPLLVLVAAAAGRRFKSTLGAVLVVVVVSSFLLGLVLTGSRQPYAFFTLPSRAWEIGLGGLVALLVRSDTRLRPVVGVVCGWSGLLLVLGSVVLIDDDARFPGWIALFPVLGAAAVLISVSSGARGLRRLLAVRPLVLVGDVSYPLYLWHWPFLVLGGAVLGRPLSPPWVVALLICSLLLAVFTKRWLEDPVQRSAGLRRRGRTVAIFAAVSAVVSAASLWGMTLPQLSTDQVAPPVAAGPFTSGYLPAYVPSDVFPKIAAAGSDVGRASRDGCLIGFLETQSPVCSYGHDDAPRTVVLFGDSHADTWFPALERIADEDGWTLVVLTKQSCPPATVTAYQTRLRRPFTECDEWRQNALRRITEIDPDLVVVGSYGRQELVSGDDEAQLARGVTDTLADLPRRAGVVWLLDNPELSQNAPSCLSENLRSPQECSESRDVAVRGGRGPAVLEALAEGGARAVDTSTWACPDARCQVLFGRTLMYRDTHHLTAAFTTSLSGALRREMGLAEARRG